MKPAVPKTRPLLDVGGFAVTDIILNLFIFFFITFSLLATFSKHRDDAPERAQELDLPASDRGRALPETAVQVVLGLDRRVAVDGLEVGADGLTDAVRRSLTPERAKVVVRAHRDLSLGQAVGLIDRVWAAEPKGVSIATLLSEPAPP